MKLFGMVRTYNINLVRTFWAKVMRSSLWLMCNAILFWYWDWRRFWGRVSVHVVFSWVFWCKTFYRSFNGFVLLTYAVQLWYPSIIPNSGEFMLVSSWRTSAPFSNHPEHRYLCIQLFCLSPTSLPPRPSAHQQSLLSWFVYFNDNHHRLALKTTNIIG